MAKNSYSIGNGALAIIVLAIVVGAYLGTGGFKSIGNNNAQTYTPTGGVSCPTAPTTTGYPRFAILAGYLNQQNNNQNTTAAIAYNITTSPSTGAALQSGVTSATSYVNSTSLGLSCGKTYVIIFAGGSDTVKNYYPQQLTVGPIGANQTTAPFVSLQKMAQILAPQFSNSTTFAVNGTTTGVTPGSLVSAGATYSNMHFILMNGAGSYGGQGIEVGFPANTVSVSSISVLGPNGQSMPSYSAVYPSTANIPSGFTTWTFELPAQTTWSQQTTYTLVVKTSSAFASNTAINMFVNDLPGFIQNGQLIYPTGGLDPNTHADLGEPLTMLGGTSEYNGISGSAPVGPFRLYSIR